MIRDNSVIHEEFYGLQVSETDWADWIIRLDGEPYAGPFDTQLNAELMAEKLAPLVGERVA